jgi:hypothetical protein
VTRRSWSLSTALLAAFLASGCLVQIEKTRNPDAAFRQALSEVRRLEGRRGRARRVHAVIYERDEQKLIRVEVPLWLVRKVESRVDWEREYREDAEREERDGREDLARRLGRHVRIRDLERAGLGVYVEVVDEDEGEHVLVWLS